ncbi:MAG: 3-phosphoshikimate 1-carboxyvinyltransferase [Flammeovirgaceae bacterium]|nr:3-phosphoshikimate 1-carboxyvinyltransferase [Flammeovirgaceae bacterium]MDW8287663.1 3-phosphoshikimate 1-carboxyvinyltransferase [Flammeovirgaceae bacterium]
MNHSSLTLFHPTGILNGVVPLPSSKSESNRALVMQALSGGKITLENLSEARDTQTMIRLLHSSDLVCDVIDAGTTMRFLTAYFTAKNRETILTGTERMCERPIGILVNALRSIGADIRYVGKEGYPPIHIKHFSQTTSAVSIRGDVSSQYISALLMIAPCLPKGLHITLEGEIASRPYLEMTLELLAYFGIAHRWEGQTIHIPPQNYQANHYIVESDWSGASYWFSMAALAKEAQIKLLNLKEKSLQGDRVIVEIAEKLGVKTSFVSDGLLLTKKETHVAELSFDFTHCPDLAQTIAVLCAALGVKARLSGLKSLRIKETDRIAAVQNELQKLGIMVNVEGDEALAIYPSSLQLANQPVIRTYDDHRMAMAFAPLALLSPIRIEHPNVVEKSYPSFWKHLKQIGFREV